VALVVAAGDTHEFATVVTVHVCAPLATPTSVQVDVLTGVTVAIGVESRVMA